MYFIESFYITLNNHQIQYIYTVYTHIHSCEDILSIDSHIYSALLQIVIYCIIFASIYIFIIYTSQSLGADGCIEDVTHHPALLRDDRFGASVGALVKLRNLTNKNCQPWVSIVWKTCGFPVRTICRMGLSTSMLVYRVMIYIGCSFLE